jgi:hypothetical protein
MAPGGMMTFAAKYEILEAVTRGAVETFVARKVATDERVLVCIFECHGCWSRSRQLLPISQSR